MTHNRSKGNILHICNFSAAYKGNFMSSLLALEEYLKEKGLKQIYIFPARANKTDAKKWIEELRNNGHIIYTQSESIKENLLLFNRIKKEYNIVTVFRHFADYKTDFLTWLIFGKKKIVRFFHCEYKRDKFPKFEIKRFVYKNETLVGVSKPVTEQIKKNFPNNKSATIENAIDFARLDTPEDFDKRSGITCLAMGYNPIVKGADLAIKAVAKLQKKNHVHLYIVAASHFDELMNTVSEIEGNTPDWLTILPPTENVSTYYSNTDIFLAPSRSEGFSYAIPESAYCKSTIVFSDIPAHKNLSVNQRYMFKSEDLSDFCQKLQLAIDELHSDDSEIKKEKNRCDVIQNYGLDRWCREVYELI